MPLGETKRLVRMIERPLHVMMAVALLAAASCSHPVDPATADLEGTLVKVAVVRGQLRLGIMSDDPPRLMPSGIDFDYSVTVRGRILVQDEHGSRQVVIPDSPPGSRVLVWTTGVELHSLPAQVSATRVLILPP